ncbi:MAG: hypothetical protein ACTSUE_13770 [Promethearchaeota archaeon]
MNQEDIITKYLSTRSPSLKRNERRYLSQLTNFLNKRNLDILNAAAPDFLDFFKWVDSIDILRISKKRYWYAVKSLSKFVTQWIYAQTGEIQELSIPPEALVQFKEKEHAVRVEENVYTESEIFKILNYLRGTNFKYYVLIGLMAFSGARVSEVVSIRSRYMNVEERYFISGTVEGFKKTDEVIYFFPRFFQSTMKVFMMQLGDLYPGSEFIFPPYQTDTRSERGFINPNQVRDRLRDSFKFIGIDDKYGISTKGFRDAINTYRKERCATTEEDRSRLLNQKTGGVNVKHYLKRLTTIRELRKLYDENFPYNKDLFD